MRHTSRRKQLLYNKGLSEELDSIELAKKLHERTLAIDALNRGLVRKEEEIGRLKARAFRTRSCIYDRAPE